MQWRVLKFKMVAFLALFALCALGQQPEQLLHQADSLYNQKKFTDAHAIYGQLYRNGYHSPVTLLRMAYVHEGLNQPAQALFFLSVYYRATEDAKAYEKILALAESAGASGFELSELDRWMIWLNNRQQYLIMVITTMLVLTMALAIWQANKNNVAGKRVSLFFNFIFLAVAGLVINGISTTKIAVVTEPGYFMSGPSAASTLVSIIPEGNLVRTEGEKDIWAQIRWKDRVGYVRKADLLMANQ